MFLACIVTGIGSLTSKITGGNLKVANEQYAYSLEEVSRLAGIANEQVVLTNQQIELTNQQVELVNATIGELEQKLAESERFVDYWRERANPREFESLDELNAWLDKDDTDSTIYIFGSGCLTGYDCDDYAAALVQNALLDGYSVSTQIEGNHMINSTIIGNKIYFIEPQNDKVWFWGYRD
jgi:hypothetical protein